MSHLGETSPGWQGELWAGSPWNVFLGTAPWELSLCPLPLYLCDGENRASAGELHNEALAVQGRTGSSGSGSSRSRSSSRAGGLERLWNAGAESFQEANAMCGRMKREDGRDNSRRVAMRCEYYSPLGFS